MSPCQALGEEASYTRCTYPASAHGSPACVATSVQVFPPANNHTDLSLTFIDWAPPPADGSMGLWRETILTSSPCSVVVRYPVVSTVLSGSDDALTAHLTVSFELTNVASTDVTGLLHVLIPVAADTQSRVTVPAQSSIIVTFDNNTISGLNVANPSLWWPAQMGAPTLHNVTAWFIASSGAQSGDQASYVLDALLCVRDCGFSNSSWQS